MNVDILSRILSQKKLEVQNHKNRTSISRVKSLAKLADPPRDFLGEIEKNISKNKPAVIAEIKKASPSKGLIRSDFDPSIIARCYEKNGATCISVLTDKKFFQGDLNDLRIVRNSTSLPILRKDFVVDQYQIFESRAAGADCVLLIVAALDPKLLMELEDSARELGMAVLVEVHTREELDHAMELKTPLIGINNRNLKTFQTDIRTTIRLKEGVPNNRIVVTESGIVSREAIEHMINAGVWAFLVGEAFMRAEDPGEELANLFKKTP